MVRSARQVHWSPWLSWLSYVHAVWLLVCVAGIVACAIQLKARQDEGSAFMLGLVLVPASYYASYLFALTSSEFRFMYLPRLWCRRRRSHCLCGSDRSPDEAPFALADIIPSMNRASLLTWMATAALTACSPPSTSIPVTLTAPVPTPTVLPMNLAPPAEIGSSSCTQMERPLWLSPMASLLWDAGALTILNTKSS